MAFQLLETLHSLPVVIDQTASRREIIDIDVAHVDFRQSELAVLMRCQASLYLSKVDRAALGGDLLTFAQTNGNLSVLAVIRIP